MTQQVKLYITTFILILLISCNEKKFAINISSKYKGWIYLVASKDLQNGFDFYPDSNGVIYIPNFCQEKTLTLKIDGKEISPTIVHSDNIFFESNSSDLLCKVTYKQFYFPLTNSDLSIFKDTGINYKEKVLNNFQYLIATNKIDRTRITSCQ
jgi:hypothetical protein